MKDILNFAVVGCGVIGDDQIQAVAKTEGARLAAICDTNREALRASAEKYGVTAYNSLDELLAVNEIDVVCFATPSGTHAALGMKAAEAGKHVIVEKPIDITLEKADALIAACKKSGVKLSCIFQNRFDRASLEVKKAIDAGIFGKPHFGACHVKWYRSSDYYKSAGWRGTWAMDGGGALINQSIHTIDLLLQFMGPVESVSGQCGTFTHEGLEVEDTGAALLRFKSGAIGIIEGTTSAYPGLGTRVDIYGSLGSVVIENRAVKEWKLLSGQEYTPDISLPERGRHYMQFNDMVDAIKNNREPLINGQEARRSLELVLAIYRSSNTGKVVKL